MTDLQLIGARILGIQTVLSLPLEMIMEPSMPLLKSYRLFGYGIWRSVCFPRNFDPHYKEDRFETEAFI